MLQIEAVLAGLVPRQFCDKLDIAHNHGVLGAGRRNHFQPREFTLGLFHDFFGRSRFNQPLVQIVDHLSGTVALTEFFLDRPHLLAEIEPALALADIRLDILLNLVLEPGELKLLAEQVMHRLGPFADAEFFKHGLLVRDIDIQIGCEIVDQTRGRLDVHQDVARLLGRVRRELD